MRQGTRNTTGAGTDSKTKVRRPLKIEEENQRRFVRLEIVSPIELCRIKDIFGNYSATGERKMEGTILNLSAGGVLVDLRDPLNEGDVVAMRFTVNGAEPLDSVLGVVKRCDTDEEGHLAGIQFVDREQLADSLSAAELELLAEHFGDFEQTVRRVLENYVYQERQ
jgi:hypothetical protein